MRLLQRGRPPRRHTKPPPQQVVAPRGGLLRLLPGHATCRTLGRDRAEHETTVPRWSARDGDVVCRTTAAIRQVGPAEQAQAVVLAARFVPHRGPQPSGRDRDAPVQAVPQPLTARCPGTTGRGLTR
jgi:hypothetical protein